MDTIKRQTCSNMEIPESNRVLLSIDRGVIQRTFAYRFGNTSSIPIRLGNANGIDKLIVSK